MADGFLVAVGLSRRFRRGGEDVVALADVDLSLARGEYLVVMGRSGSGKTTLLNLLGGLDRPTAGEVRFDGESLGQLGESRITRLRLERIGFVFQDFCLVAGLNALDNVRLPLYLAGRLRRSSRRASELLVEMGLEGRADHFPGQLSRGEIQRVAIARALVCNPDLLLVDEPTGNLDAESSSAVRSILTRFSSQQGKTIIVATHDPDLAADAHRQVNLSYGRLAPN